VQPAVRSNRDFVTETSRPNGQPTTRHRPYRYEGIFAFFIVVCPRNDETHEKCPRNVPRASRRNARETVSVGGMRSGLSMTSRAEVTSRYAKAYVRASKKDKGGSWAMWSRSPGGRVTTPGADW